jgi:hypothetical protein
VHRKKAHLNLEEKRDISSKEVKGRTVYDGSELTKRLEPQFDDEDSKG